MLQMVWKSMIQGIFAAFSHIVRGIIPAQTNVKFAQTVVGNAFCAAARFDTANFETYNQRMYKKPNIKLRKTRVIGPQTVFLIAVALLVFGPFTSMEHIGNWVYDCAIQIKLGMDGIDAGHMITDEIYSWHEGLVFTAHESGWYLIVGFLYKYLGVWGVLAVCSVLSCSAAIAAAMFSRKKVHPLFIAAALVLVRLMRCFPDYSARPSTSSTLIFIVTIIVLLSDREPIFKAGVFTIFCLLLAWLHGGFVPIYFAVYALFIVFELLYKNFKDAGVLACGILSGFAVSLLNPIGFGLWSYGLKQTGSAEAISLIDEWKPLEFDIVQVLILLLVLVGFMAGKGVREFEKKALIKLALFCMFFIMACVYRRFALLLSIAFVLFAPEAYQDLAVWLRKNLLPKLPDKIKLSNAFYGLLAGVAAVMIVLSGVFYSGKYIKTNTMADAEAIAAFDKGAADYVEEAGYEKIFNSFDTGSWLVFNGIKVHIDNRFDPYNSAFSGTDYLTGKMEITNLYELDSFRAEYDCDAFLLDVNPVSCPLLNEIELYASDRYKIVYDNTVTSVAPNHGSIRWIVIECI